LFIHVISLMQSNVGWLSSQVSTPLVSHVLLGVAGLKSDHRTTNYISESSAWWMHVVRKLYASLPTFWALSDVYPTRIRHRWAEIDVNQC
ncbi:MAG: hypothetical protein KDE46_29500, partial [Caldilineaceae bacterium]|nr:hypothetical protein [Caldilineaceae bacterium]